MPYFLFELHTLPIRQVRKISEFASFKEASQAAKALRVSMELPRGTTIKLMHGETEFEAESLLMEERVSDRNAGDD